MRPFPFDIDYTRTLGYGAARALLSEPSDQYPEKGGLICLVGSDIKVMPFDEMRDPGDRTHPRAYSRCRE